MTPPLPAELIYRIILLSLPSTIAFEALPDRYALLLSYALVSKAWTPWAQLELYRHVLLQGDEGVARFSASTEGTGGRLVGQVISLRASGKNGESETDELHDVSEQCSSLTDLRLKSHGVLLKTLASFLSLTQMHLRDVQVDCTRLVTSFATPCLAQLSIINVVAQPRGAWTYLLNSISMPNLSVLAVALNLDYVDRYSPSVSALAQALASMGYLTTVRLNDPYQLLYPYLDDAWPNLDRLKDLSLARSLVDDGADLPLRSALKRLPSSLQKLPLIPPRPSGECQRYRLGNQFNELQSFLTTPPNALQDVHRLILPDDCDLCDECKRSGERMRLTAVEDSCTQRGIEIVREVGEGGEEGGFEGRESYLDEQ